MVRELYWTRSKYSLYSLRVASVYIGRIYDGGPGDS